MRCLSALCLWGSLDVHLSLELVVGARAGRVRGHRHGGGAHAAWETVRDTVYQTCQHNGVHFNKQGHANCGLHKGWSDDPTTATGDEPGDQPTTESGGAGDGQGVGATPRR